ncbi:hypothetical protein NKI34_20440 [Mesorhizobium sp. M0700]
MADPSVFAAAAEQFLDVLRTNRPAEMIALHFVAIVPAQESHLIICLNALGDDPQVEILPQ